MDDKKIGAITEKILSAWNRQDVDEVLACYTEDCIYRDPNTQSAIKGHEKFGRYLRKLFDQWEMHWSTREYFQFSEEKGCAFLWHATLTPVSGGETFEIDGMDLAIIRGEKLYRNEVYFDRMALLTKKITPTEVI